jgi:hypothetical protein
MGAASLMLDRAANNEMDRGGSRVNYRLTADELGHALRALSIIDVIDAMQAAGVAMSYWTYIPRYAAVGRAVVAMGAASLMLDKAANNEPDREYQSTYLAIADELEQARKSLTGGEIMNDIDTELRRRIRDAMERHDEIVATYRALGEQMGYSGMELDIWVSQCEEVRRSYDNLLSWMRQQNI